MKVAGTSPTSDALDFALLEYPGIDLASAPPAFHKGRMTGAPASIGDTEDREPSLSAIRGHRSALIWLRYVGAGHPLFTKTLSNLAHLAGGNAAASLLNAIVLLIMARMLGPALLGVFAMVESYGTLVDQLVRLETWQPLIRYGSQALEMGNDVRLKALIKLGILIDCTGAAVAAAVAFLFIPVVAHLVGWDDVTIRMARWYCLTVLAGISSTPIGVLRIFDRFKQMAWLETATALVRLAAVAVASWLHGSLWHLIAIFIVVQLLYRITLGLLASRELARRRFSGIAYAPLAELHDIRRGYIRLTLATNATALVRKSTQELDVLVVGGIAGASVVGIYDLVRRITNAAIKGATMIQQVALPDLSRLWARADIAAFRAHARQIELFTVAIGVVFVAVVALGGRSLVTNLAGPRFHGAAAPLLVQTIAACLFMCGSAIRPALITMGQETRLFGIVLAAAIVFYLTLFLAVPVFGAIGASAAHVAFNMVMLPLAALTFASALRAYRSPATSLSHTPPS